MWAANPTWGSPRIRDELEKLGVHVSTATIRKYRPSSGGRRSQSWRTFLRNHGAAIAAMDFFVVPTATFRLLYVLIVVTHHLQPNRPLQHHGVANRRVDRPAGGQCLSVRHGPPNTFCGAGIRSTGTSSCGGSSAHGNRAEADRAEVSVAEPLRGAPDWSIRRECLDRGCGVQRAASTRAA